LNSKPNKSAGEVASSANFGLYPVSGGFFLGLLFVHEDGGDMVL
jgi:hypothetical protein